MTYVLLMPWGLKRYQQSGNFHFVTFSCYRRKPKLGTAQRRAIFEMALEHTRVQYRFVVAGYVVMPEHVHMLVSEPEVATLARALQSLKQSVSRTLALRADEPFWQERYYDFNVYTEDKHVEKLRYMHRNPVKRGLCSSPENWLWSSFRHYLTGEEGVVELESDWTARKRERMGIFPTVKIRQETTPP